MERRRIFADNTQVVLRKLVAEGPAGNKWFKVNLHVHGRGNDPAEIVREARAAEIDLLAVTDHQTFEHYDEIAREAVSPGRTLVVLPGIEITSLEGVHVLAIFPLQYTGTQRTQFIGWLEIPGSGDTSIASRKQLSEILKKVTAESGIIVVPHPFAEKMGLLDGARKISTKIEWLESGSIHLMQVSSETENKIRHYDRDAEGNWVNRFVLTSANAEQVAGSSYCLAPFNRSDAHSPDEISKGCSWFRMAEATVAGLEQVACEPRTRIAREQPPESNSDCILAVCVRGGYCNGQLFFFNDRLNCVVGPNHAGKSAILDFIRFALADEDRLPLDSKRKLLARLNAILWRDGQVEVFVRYKGAFFIVRRLFQPEFDTSGATVVGCSESPRAYRMDGNALVPVDDFSFPLEIYEQGRISRLREDVGRQLQMLDEFAGLEPVLEARAETVRKLNESAKDLAPLYEEQDQLKSQVNSLPELKQQLSELEKLSAGEEDKKWGAATTVFESLDECVTDLGGVAEDIPKSGPARATGPTGELERLFAQKIPEYDDAKVAESELLAEWAATLKTALGKIASARADITRAIESLAKQSATLRKKWNAARSTHERIVRERLAKAGVESPQEIIEKARQLRKAIDQIEGSKQRRLSEVGKLIERHEKAREQLLSRLEDVNEQITAVRRTKAQELTNSLDGQKKITLAPIPDTTEYRVVLDALCKEISSPSRRVRDRDGQINAMVSRLSPLRLARVLTNGGFVVNEDGSKTPLQQFCPGVTENTVKMLVGIADDIRALNRLQTATLSDTPYILVRRRSESTYGELSTGLSPGEQSAALLTVALQTRTIPLILDQPEDELGYSYVVHLIVPKVLSAKAARQLVVVTHNANIPVLGDADHVTRMENRPRQEGSRECVIATQGCFENATVTAALVELEGGSQAFRFRQHRYALPAHGGLNESSQPLGGRSVGTASRAVQRGPLADSHGELPSPLLPTGGSSPADTTLSQPPAEK